MKVLVSRTDGEWHFAADDALLSHLDGYFARCKGFGITQIEVDEEDLITSRCVDDRKFVIPGGAAAQMGLF